MLAGTRSTMTTNNKYNHLQNMKRILTVLIVITYLYSCSIFEKRPYVPPIGAEKLFSLQQPGYKPKTKYQKTEYRVAMKQIKRDNALAKKLTIPNY